MSESSVLRSAEESLVAAENESFTLTTQFNDPFVIESESPEPDSNVVCNSNSSLGDGHHSTQQFTPARQITMVDCDDVASALPKPLKMLTDGEDERTATGTIGSQTFHQEVKGAKRSPLRLLNMPQSRPGRLLQLGSQPRPFS
jgi:hypothetical protein